MRTTTGPSLRSIFTRAEIVRRGFLLISGVVVDGSAKVALPEAFARDSDAWSIRLHRGMYAGTMHGAYFA